MSYADAGAGSPIVLVHGWAANGLFFRDLATELAKTHRVLTLTLRGHPGSEAGKAPLTIETLADDIVHLFETLDIRGAAAIGWSMGAMALWAATSRLAGRLSALVVEDMGPRLINDESWAHGIASGYTVDNIAGTVTEIRSDWRTYVNRFAPRLFAPSVREACPELEAWAAGEMAKADAEAMASFWISMAAQDFRTALTRIATPMLVIHGGESQIYDDGATAFVAQTAPNAKRVVIPGAGHVPHLEAPDSFFKEIEAFVRDTRRPDLRSGGAVP